MGLAVLFPGQGVQTPGMGREWQRDRAWSVVERAEEALGTRVAPLLLDDSAAVLNRTRSAQLGVFLASLLAWEATKDRLGEPTAFAGHSLGQVTALVAAGILTLEDGVRLVDARGRSTQEAAQARPGRMAALLGASADDVARACSAADGACWLANDNAPGQLVVGGTPTGVDAATRHALDNGVRRMVSLNVEAAFHTPLMEDACDAFARALEAVPLQPATAPVVSNDDAEVYSDGDSWRRRLVRHLVSPVRWRQSIHALVELGVKKFVELGPGSSVSGMARRTVPKALVVTVGTPAHLPALGEVV
ncbi:MAG TPA: ACP S-malonyltransferase [Acidimicrobiales bacterium]